MVKIVRDTNAVIKWKLIFHIPIIKVNVGVLINHNISI